MNNVGHLRAFARQLDITVAPTTALFDEACEAAGLPNGTSDHTRARVRTLCRVGAFDQAAIELLGRTLPQWRWGRDPSGYVRLWLGGDNQSGPGTLGIDCFSLALLRVTVAALIARAEDTHA